ncbi:MAG TPA: hypothetical protein VM639_10875 [Dongiaceae bacterium]|nr:hypothetical protein [Dongiaceae bacterium]
MPATAGAATTVVGKTLSTSGDGSVTTIITYGDGHMASTVTLPATASPAAYLRAGDLRAAKASLGQILNILV